MNSIELPSLKLLPKIGLMGIHVVNPGTWLVEEVRHYYRGSVNSIFLSCNRRISLLGIKKAIQTQYKRYILYSYKAETVICINDVIFIIEVYLDPDDKSIKPGVLLLFKDGKLYAGDVRRIKRLHLTSR